MYGMGTKVEKTESRNRIGYYEKVIFLENYSMTPDAELERILARKEKLKLEMTMLAEEERKRKKVIRERRAAAILKALETLGVDEDREIALAQAVKMKVCQNADNRFTVLVQWLHGRAPMMTMPAEITAKSERL